MPISDIQNQVLRCIATNRNPQSYLAGATVLHRSPSSPRYSQDIDLFHDVAESVAICAEQDAATLLKAGFSLKWLLRTPTFYRAVLAIDNQQMKIEWAHDSAFRFFPVQQDAWCGFRLHDADAATNKLLALAGRTEIRDFIDVMHLLKNYLSLGALAWAACGKDAGFTPEFLLDQANRHTACNQNDLNRLQLHGTLDAVALKREWLDAIEEARVLVSKLPPDEVGCLYLTPQLEPVTPAPDSESFPQLIRHHGSVCGSWPTVTLEHKA